MDPELAAEHMAELVAVYLDDLIPPEVRKDKRIKVYRAVDSVKTVVRNRLRKLFDEDTE